MANEAYRLLADIGGTNARFALLAFGAELPEREHNLLCGDYPGLVEAVRAYLAMVGVPAVAAAALDVAVDVTGDRVKLTNNHWSFSIADVRAALGLDELHVINDFTALALAVPKLAEHELQKLWGGAAVAGTPLALIGAGTGLGVSGLVPVEGRWVALSGEGGHTNYAPMTDREAAMLVELRRMFGSHVSTERVASGPGLSSIRSALAAVDRIALAELSPEEITRRALDEHDPRCLETLDVFCAALGTATANLVLTLGARGGAYIGGGVVPRLGAYFAQSPFRARYLDVGRFRAYVEPVPIYLIIAENPALRGVASVFDGR